MGQTDAKMRLEGAEGEEEEGKEVKLQWSRGSTLFLLWNCGCLLWCFKCWGWLSVAGQDFVYVAYWPLVPLVAMMWLWGMNVSHFDKKGIKYEMLFGTEGNPVLLKGTEIVRLATLATSWMVSNLALCIAFFVLQVRDVALWIPGLFLNELTICSDACVVFLSTSISFWIHSLLIEHGLCLNLKLLWIFQMPNMALLVPCFFYITLIVLAVCPMKILYKDARVFFIRTLFRALCPVQNVTFSDFILADILTSLAKAMAEMQLALCLLVTGEASPGIIENMLSDPIGVCGRGSWHVNFILALPYLCRLVQCMIVFRTLGDTNQLFNALKYSTAIPVILFSYIRYHAKDASSIKMWWTLWLLASTVNTLYSFYWDIEMDWDISWFSQGQGNRRCLRAPHIKSDSLYPKSFYTWAISSNLLIRVLWIYKLSSHLRFSKGISFLVAFLEVLRRHQWVYIRVECGLRKSQKDLKLQPGRMNL